MYYYSVKNVYNTINMTNCQSYNHNEKKKSRKLKSANKQ